MPRDERDLAEYPTIIASYRAGLKSFMIVPLISKGEVVAVMRLQTFEADAFSEDDVRIGELIGAHVAGAIANAQQFAEHNRAEQEVKLLAELAHIVNSSLDIGDVYQTFGEKILSFIPYDRMSLSFANYERQTMSPTWVLGTDVPGLREGDDFPMERSLAGEVVHTKAASHVGCGH